MLFNSQIFVFVFLPLVLVSYYSLHKLGFHNFAKLALLVASFVFYGYNYLPYLVLLLSSIVINYSIYYLMQKLDKDAVRARKTVLSLGIILNLSFIFYFKYFDFFISNVNLLFKTDIKLLQLALPLGISFFTFQQIAFLIDSYRDETGSYGILEYSLYVSFFPQLVAGPIVLHKDLIHQFSEEYRYRLDSSRVLVGIRYFTIGLFKKTMIADKLSIIVSYGYAHDYGLSLLETVLVILSYTLQIYFDFSGYSDMAVGLGKLLGFDLPINFDEPYKATDISDFWKHWHITMTRFFTQYLYIPLGGNRKGMVRTCINTLIVFALSGLWHGAGWTFVIWGVLHGCALVLYRLFRRYIEYIPVKLRRISTFVYVNIAWVFFRANDWLQVKRILIGLKNGGLSIKNLEMFENFCGENFKMIANIFFNDQVIPSSVFVLITLIFVIVVLVMSQIASSSHKLANREDIGRYEGTVWAVLMVLSIMTFMNVSEFLYFNF